MKKYTSALPTIIEEDESSIIMESIVEKIESFIEKNPANPNITEIQEIITRLTAGEDRFKDIGDIEELFDLISELAKSNPALVEILEEFEKLPVIQELEEYCGSHDATAREGNILGEGVVGDVVANEDGAKTGIASGESEEEKKRRRLEEERLKSLSRDDRNITNSYHRSSSSELDTNGFAAMILKLAGALAIGLACPGAGLFLAALFLYGTRNIANGKKITHIDERDNNNGPGFTSDVLTKYMEAERQKTQAPGNMEQATAGVQDKMEIDLEKIKQDLIEAKSLLEKAIKPDIEIDVETAKKYDVKLNPLQLEQEDQHSKSEQKGQKCLIKLDQQQGASFKKNLDEKIAKCEAQIEKGEGR
jgi:hypothetical protein